MLDYVSEKSGEKTEVSTAFLIRDPLISEVSHPSLAVNIRSLTEIMNCPKPGLNSHPPSKRGPNPDHALLHFRIVPTLQP